MRRPRPPTLTARRLAAHRARLARTRPSTPGADVEAEGRLYRDVGGIFAAPAGRPAAVALRTRVVDAEVARAIGRGTAQVLLLAAGYDGRALRFGGGAVRWFEVDLPSTQADKRRRLDALGIRQAGVTYVAVDLGTEDLGAALDAAGHDAAAPSLLVCEDLFGSLGLEATASVCQALRTRAPAGSVLLATFRVAPEPGSTLLALDAGIGALRRFVGDPPQHVLRPGDPEKLMVVTGWRVAQAESAAASRVDRSARMLALVCEPGPAR